MHTNGLQTHMRLKLITQPEGVGLSNIVTFATQTEQETTRIYILDSGVDGTNPVRILGSAWSLKVSHVSIIKKYQTSKLCIVSIYWRSPCDD